MQQHHPYSGYDAPGPSNRRGPQQQPPPMAYNSQMNAPQPPTQYAGYPPPSPSHASNDASYNPQQTMRMGSRTPVQSGGAGGMPHHPPTPGYQPSAPQARDPRGYAPNPAQMPPQSPSASHPSNVPYGAGPPSGPSEAPRPPIHLDGSVPPSMGPPIHFPPMNRGGPGGPPTPRGPPPPPATPQYQANPPSYHPQSSTPNSSAGAGPGPYGNDPYRRSWSAGVGSESSTYGQPQRLDQPYQQQQQKAQQTGYPPQPGPPTGPPYQGGPPPLAGAGPSNPYPYGGGGGGGGPTPLPPSYDYTAAPPRQPSTGPERHRGGARDNGPYARGPGGDNRAGGGAAASAQSRISRQGVSHLDREDPRTADEKPGRTLFVRNIDNSVDANVVRSHFARFGEIRNFFELVAKRGICFITYFDLRGAELAKGECHGMQFSGRQVDVHFSLPKDQDTSKRCDKDQNQGTLFMLLKRHPRALTDTDFRNIYAQFGEIKSVRRYKDQKNARFLEFFDSRACVAAHDHMGGTEWGDGSGEVGQWDIKYAWDASMVGKGGGGNAGGQQAAQQQQQQQQQPSFNQGQELGGRAPLPPGHHAAAAYGGGPGPGMSPQQGPPHGFSGGPPGGPSPYGAPSQGAGPAPPASPYQQNPHQSPPAPTRQWGTNPYASTPTPSPQQHSQQSGHHPSQGPSGPTPPPGSESQNRLEQAQKVQQLLASLSSSNGGQQQQQQQQQQKGTDGKSAPAGLPPNIASLLAGAGAGAGAGANPGANTGSNAGGAATGSNASNGATTTGPSSAQQAQQSIEAMLKALQQK